MLCADNRLYIINFIQQTKAMKQAVAFVAVLFAVVFMKYADARCSNVRGYVYIMQEKAAPGASTTYLHYKVGGVEGDSKKVKTRRGNLQTGNPRQLVVMNQYEVSTCREAEKACQNAVSQYAINYRGGTEWFRVPSSQYAIFVNSTRNVASTFPVTSFDDINDEIV